MTVACLSLRMSPAEALTATTIQNAAHALGIGDVVGSIEPDKQADLVIWRVTDADQIPYWPAADLRPSGDQARPAAAPARLTSVA